MCDSHRIKEMSTVQMDPFFLEPQLSIRRTLTRGGSKIDFPAPYWSLTILVRNLEPVGISYPGCMGKRKRGILWWHWGGQRHRDGILRALLALALPELLNEALVTLHRHCESQTDPFRCPCTDTFSRKLSKAEGISHNCVLWNKLELKHFLALIISLIEGIT